MDKGCGWFDCILTIKMLIPHLCMFPSHCMTVFPATTSNIFTVPKYCTAKAGGRNGLFLYEWFCSAVDNDAVSGGLCPFCKRYPFPIVFVKAIHQLSPHRFPVAHELFNNLTKSFSLAEYALCCKHPFPHLPHWDTESFNWAEETEIEKNW